MSDFENALLMRVHAVPETQARSVVRDLLSDAATLQRLLVETVASGIFVQFHAQLAEWELGLAGGFCVRNGVPTIQLYREEGQAIAGDPVQETITLAHEVGHAISWREGRRSAAYVAVVDLTHDPLAKFSEDQALLVLDEECRAWARARRILNDVGFDRWRQFSERHTNDLEIYCQRLGLAPGRWATRVTECERGPVESQPSNFCDRCDGLGWVPQYEEERDE